MALARIESPIARSFRESLQPKKDVKLHFGSLESDSDIKNGIKRIKKGEPIAFQFRNVFGLCLDGSNIDSISKVLGTKMDPNLDKPFSAMISNELFLSLVDKSKINPKIVELMDDPDEYVARIGSICHIRAPITLEATQILPKSMYSWKDGVPYMHNLDTTGHSIHELVIGLENQGIPVAVTTLNQHGYPEISRLPDAQAYLASPYKNKGIKYVLEDTTPTLKEAQGSLTIVEITGRPDGKLTGTRHGHIPYPLLEKILGIEIDYTNANSAAYPQHEGFSTLLELGLTPQELRLKAIALMAIKA